MVCYLVKQGVRSGVQLSCTDTLFQKCSQGGKNVIYICGLQSDFVQKKSKETLKKSKSLILLCKFCSWAQKSPKIPPKKFALNRDLLNFFRPDLIGLTFLD